MTRNTICALVAFAVVLTVLVVAVHRLFRGAKIVLLPEEIKTVRAGIPFAVEVKNSLAPEAQLTSVEVMLNCSGAVLSVQELEYGFAVVPQKSRAIVVSVNNTVRKAFCVLDTTAIPAYTKAAPAALKPFDLSRVTLEIPDVLKIAETNGLAEFCALTRPDTRQVSLWLGFSDAGLVWSVNGDSWDEQGPVADVRITVDAQNGTVVDHALQKPANRPHP